jgi:hypothetical protein
MPVDAPVTIATFFNACIEPDDVAFVALKEYRSPFDRAPVTLRNVCALESDDLWPSSRA